MKTPFILETGPLFIGVLFNWGLLGAFLVQIYIYAVWYHHTDRGAVRYIVYTLFVVEAVQTGLMTHTAWEILAYNWGDPTVLLNIPWSSATTPIVGGIVAMIVQLYFAWRIWILQQNMISGGVAIVASLLSLLQCICAVTYGGKFIASGLDATLLDAPTFKVLAVVWLSGNVSCDVIIAVSLVYIFSVVKSNSIARTGNVLNRLIIQTIQSGVITALVACAHLAIYLAFPHTFLDLPAVYTLSKLYSNILLANLNNRNRINDGGAVLSVGISLPGDTHTWKFRPGPYNSEPESAQTRSTRTRIGRFTGGDDMSGDISAIEMGPQTSSHAEEENKKAHAW
ncbi:hypothetical protein DFH09DRAFT_1149268 [Mycena vulgaris]|nr:hypothetical protein DFH09DRAFT_1149268 [Mycena vulgaris]